MHRGQTEERKEENLRREKNVYTAETSCSFGHNRQSVWGDKVLAGAPSKGLGKRCGRESGGHGPFLSLTYTHAYFLG